MCSLAKKNEVDLSLSLIFEDYDPGLLGPEQKRDIRSLFLPSTPSLLQRQTRLAFQLLSGNLPRIFRQNLVKILRIIRNTARQELKAAPLCRFNEVVMDLENQGLTRRGYLGHPSVVCLSYDIDKSVGYRHLDEIIRLLCRAKLPATFYVLTNWEYKIDWGKMRLISDAGFEISLHGGKHDVALGYRGEDSIRSEIKRAIEDIPLEVLGYRAPALCMTPKLMKVIGEMGFRYDSSLPMSNMYYKSVETCFPYLCCAGKMWELPVVIQDSTLFLDLKLSENDAFVEMKSVIDDVRKLGGVCTVNLHPYIIVGKTRFHNRLVGYLSNQSDMLVSTQNSLCDYIDRVTSIPDCRP